MSLSGEIDGGTLDDWQAKGWVLLPGFLAPDRLTELRQEADRLWADRSLFDTRGAVPNSPTRKDRLDPVIDVSPSFAALAADRSVTGAMSAILGGQAQLFKDKFIAKPAGTVGYATHQDGAYWQGLGLDLSRMLSAFFFLDDSPAERGTIECAPSHHHGLLTEPGVIADPDDGPLGEFETVDARAGDVLLVHALTPHRSGPNRTEHMRRAIVLSYAVDDRPDLYRIYRQGKQAANY